MIEDPTINRNNICATAFMVGVAYNTFALLCGVKQAVKSGSLYPVITNFLMAVDAQSRLRKI